MEDHELARILRTMYENAKRNEAVCQINLFGIMYADEIKKSGCSVKRIVELSGIRQGYLSEVTKGMKLSKYVTVKEGVKNECF